MRQEAPSPSFLSTTNTSLISNGRFQKSESTCRLAPRDKRQRRQKMGNGAGRALVGRLAQQFAVRKHVPNSGWHGPWTMVDGRAGGQRPGTPSTGRLRPRLVPSSDGPMVTLLGVL